MSRIAKMPVILPNGVEAVLNDHTLTIKGKQGTLVREIHPTVVVKVENKTLIFDTVDDSKEANIQSGTTRALVNAMVQGVFQGFSKKLQLVGVGYRAQLEGKNLVLNLGFSHPIKYTLPDGVKASCPSQTEVVISGADKQLVGQTAANIRSYRKPEPYKGKGIKYDDEVVYRKEAKKK